MQCCCFKQRSPYVNMVRCTNSFSVHHDLDKQAAERDSNMIAICWAEPCSQYSHVECMRMQQLDIFIFWHERNVGAAAALFNQDKFVTTRISYNSHKSVAIIKIYVCNLIISGPNCSLSSLVFYSHIHLSSSSTTTATDVCPLFVHVFHNLFAST